MKNLAVILFSLALSFLGNSQVVVLQVNEVQSFFGDPTWKFDRVLADPYYSSAPVHKDCRYVVNFNDSTVAFYRNGEMIEEGPAQILTQDGISIVKILEDGFNFGLIVDLRLESESAILYQIYDDEIECMKFTDFQIIRPS